MVVRECLVLLLFFPGSFPIFKKIITCLKTFTRWPGSFILPFQRETVPVPESDGGTLLEVPSHSEAIKGNARRGVHSSEVSGTEEVEQTTLPKKTSKKTKATHLHTVSVTVCNLTAKFLSTFYVSGTQSESRDPFAGS